MEDPSARVKIVGHHRAPEPFQAPEPQRRQPEVALALSLAAWLVAAIPSAALSALASTPFVGGNLDVGFTLRATFWNFIQLGVAITIVAMAVWFPLQVFLSERMAGWKQGLVMALSGLILTIPALMFFGDGYVPVFYDAPVLAASSLWIAWAGWALSRWVGRRIG